MDHAVGSAMAKRGGGERKYEEIENSQWLNFLRPFNGVKDLYLTRQSTQYIAPTLRELVGERVIEV